VRGLRTSVAIAGLAAIALAMSACGSKSGGNGNSSAGNSAANSATAGGGSSVAAPASTTASTKALNACMVLDTGGVDDKSFNQSSYAGMQAAQKANPNIKISYVPSNSGNDYTPNLKNETSKGCGTIIAVGGLMSGNVKTVASSVDTWPRACPSRTRSRPGVV
jgi:basic membrane protein A